MLLKSQSDNPRSLTAKYNCPPNKNNRQPEICRQTRIVVINQKSTPNEQMPPNEIDHQTEKVAQQQMIAKQDCHQNKKGRRPEMVAKQKWSPGKIVAKQNGRQTKMIAKGRHPNANSRF